MKNIFRSLATGAIVLSVLLMARHYGDCQEPAYQLYSSADAELNVTMDFITGWDSHESRGSYGSYAQVQFTGPLQGAFAPGFIVTVEPAAFNSAEEKADALVNKRMYFKDAQVVARAQTQLLGEPAVDLILTYKQPNQLYSLDVTLIPFRERVVITQKDGRHYTVRYVFTEEGFGQHEEGFQHCLGTLAIKE